MIFIRCIFPLLTSLLFFSCSSPIQQIPGIQVAEVKGMKIEGVEE